MNSVDIIIAMIVLGAIFYFYNSYSQSNNTLKQKYQEAFKKFRIEYIDTKSGKLKKDLGDAVSFAEYIVLNGGETDLEVPKTSYDAEVKKYIIVSSTAKIEQFARQHRGNLITDDERDANEQVIYFCSELLRELFKTKELSFIACDQLTLNLVKAGTEAGCNLDYNRIGIKFDSMSDMATEVVNSLKSSNTTISNSNTIISNNTKTSRNKKTKTKIIMAVSIILSFLFLILIFGEKTEKESEFLVKYQDNSSVRQIILVEQSSTKKSEGTLTLFSKNLDTGKWKEILQCNAFLGVSGIDKTTEDDGKTPTGDFGILMSFGIKDNPGTSIPYTKLTDTMYLCHDREYYNQFIDTSKIAHRCSNGSAHLIDYGKQYNYAIMLDYNKERVFGKGFAIFLHCFGKTPFNWGSIAIEENNIVKILQNLDKNARICICHRK